MLKTKSIFRNVTLILSIILPMTLSASEELEGTKAPMIVGQQAIGKGLIKLSRVTSEFSYKKDENGKLIKENGKYVFEIQKNVVVLNFFSTTCIPCIKEIPVYNKLAEKYTDQPVRFLYVNVDESADKLKIKRLIARKHIQVPMMLPNQREVIRKYNVVSLPRIVVIDKEGIIAVVMVGYKEDLEKRLSDSIDRLLF